MLVRHDADVWSTEYCVGWPAGLFQIPVRMTLLRLADQQIILHSPGPISPGRRNSLSFHASLADQPPAARGAWPTV